jgi:NADH-quinone oxidoreductase subunit H
MRFGWKVLIPISVVWIMIVAILRGVFLNYGWSRVEVASFLAGAIVVGIALLAMGARNRRTRAIELETHQIPEKFDPYAGGYPVPPLPGQDYRPVRRQPLVAEASSSADQGATVITSQEVHGG